MESTAISLIFKRIDKGEYELVTSDVLMYELSQTNDIIKKVNFILLTSREKHKIKNNDIVISRAEEFEKFGFKPYDALHLASAEYSKANVLITTDDRFLKNAKKNKSKLMIKVITPVEFIEDI